MINRRHQIMIGASALLLIGFGGGWAMAWLNKVLYINGKVASTTLLEKNGRTYAPIADVARTLEMDIRSVPGGFDLVSRPLPTESAAIFGKVGETVTNDQFSLTVLEVVRGRFYKKRYTWGEEMAKPDKDFVAVVCRLRNATGKEARVDPVGGKGTALIDAQERSYLPYRGLAADIPALTVNLLPQSSVDFAITFEVPKGLPMTEFRYQIIITGDNRFRDAMFRINIPTVKAGKQG